MVFSKYFIDNLFYPLYITIINHDIIFLGIFFNYDYIGIVEYAIAYV